MADLNKDLFKQLAQIAFGGANEKNIAEMILSKSMTGLGDIPDYTKKNMAPVSKDTKGGGPSVLSRIIDVVSRPLYAMGEGQSRANDKWRQSENDLVNQRNKANPTGKQLEVPNPQQDMKANTDVLGGMAAGFKGKEKTTFSKMLKEEGKISGKGAGSFATGLTFDILGDPLSFLGPGLVKNAAKVLKGDEAVKSISPMSNKLMQATEDAPKVGIALEQTVKDAAVAEHALSPMQATQAMLSKQKDANIFLKATDSSVAAEKTFNDLMKNVTYKSRGGVQQALDKNGKAIAARVSEKPRKNAKTGRFASATAKTFPKVVHDTTRALNEVLDEPIRTLKVGETISEKGAVHGIMARVATWWGQKDLRPLALDATTSARANAERLIKAWDNTLAGHTDDEILEAWNVATKAKPHDLVDPKVGELADKLTGGMEIYFKSSGISDAAAKANSVAMRSGAVMSDVNHMLKRYGIKFQFTNGKAFHPQLFKDIDYSQGTNWLNSWETAKFADAKEMKKFIFGLQSAMQQLTKEYAFVDDVAERFGHVKPKKGVTTRVHHPRLAGVYFPNEMADQLSMALNTMNDFYRPNSPMMKFIAGATSTWKAAVTKYYPSHHIRNIQGDTWLAWMAGVNDPRVFTKAGKVMHSQRGLYSDLKGVEELTDPNALARAMAKPGAAIAKNKSGAEFTADQIYIAAHNYGLLQKANAVEDIIDGGFQVPKPLGGKLSGPVNALSENREHFVKLAHFIDVVQKSKGKNYKDIFENAAHEVRKWHPDALDLTRAEQKARLLIPFYSWSRKSIPLIMEGAAMRPQKAFGVPAKIQYNAQESLGIEGTSLSDPFPADQLFPEWMKERSIGPLGKTGMGGLAGMIGGAGRQGVDEEGNPVGGYTNLGPSNPLQDMMQMFGGGPKSAIMSSLNPGAKVPIEVGLTGEDSFSHLPVSTNKGEYATKQLPGLANLLRIYDPTGITRRGEEEGAFNQEALINQLFAANLQGTGPQIDNASFESIDDKKKMNKKYRQFAKEQGVTIGKNSKIPDYIKNLFEQQQGSR